MDLIPEPAGRDAAPIQGLYKLDGDTYTEVIAQPGKPRPTSFTAPKGSGRTLLVYRRKALGRAFRPRFRRLPATRSASLAGCPGV